LEFFEEHLCETPISIITHARHRYFMEGCAVSGEGIESSRRDKLGKRCREPFGCLLVNNLVCDEVVEEAAVAEGACEDGIKRLWLSLLVLWDKKADPVEEQQESLDPVGVMPEMIGIVESHFSDGSVVCHRLTSSVCLTPPLWGATPTAPVHIHPKPQEGPRH